MARPRVLEIGCGSGQNLHALATSYPDGEFLGIDLAPSAIAEAKALAADCALENVRFKTANILDASEWLEGEFDYIICHGVYSWVPEVVREAILAVIARFLAPTGVGYVSYNANPGCRIRQIVREMALHEIGHIEPASERMVAAQQFFRTYAAADDGKDITRRMMRGLARVAGDRPPEVIIHDELGEHFEPQSILDFITAANRHGLEYLHDARGPYRPQLTGEGGDLSDHAVARRAMSLDYARMTFFHWSLVVRAGRSPSRQITREALSKVWVSSTANYDEEKDHFQIVGATLIAKDETLRDSIRALAAQRPHRVPLDEFFTSDFDAEQILEIYDNGLIRLHASDWHFPLAASERPRTSNLVRQQIARGTHFVSCLDHRTAALTDPAARSLIALLDGTRSVAQIEADWRATGDSAGQQINVGLWLAARLALLIE